MNYQLTDNFIFYLGLELNYLQRAKKLLLFIWYIATPNEAR